MRNVWNEESITSKILDVMDILQINHMPTSNEISVIKEKGLSTAIQRNGGFIYWAKKLGLNNKIPKTKMDNQDIANNIMNLVNESNIKKMPTRQQIIDFYKNNSLHGFITKNGGYYFWADKLGLEIQENETYLGYKYQEICKEKLIELGFNVNNTSTKAPYDLIVNDNIRIDVKCGCAYLNNGSRIHTFGINHKFPTCDIYVIYALDETSKNIEKIFVIPSKELKMSTLNIGKNSKYDIYLEKWEYLNKYEDFYKSF